MDLNLPLNFDCTSVAPNYGGTGAMFPESDDKGWLVQITGGEMRQTRDKTGTMLVLSLEGLDDAVKGISVEYRLNVVNSSPQATEIAKGNLCALGKVCGVQKIGPVKDIAHKPFRVIVAKSAKNENLEIRGVRNVNGDAAPIAASQNAVSNAPQAPQAPARMTMPAETIEPVAPIANTPQWDAGGPAPWQ